MNTESLRHPTLPAAGIVLLLFTACDPTSLCKDGRPGVADDVDCDGSVESTVSLRDAAAGRFHSRVRDAQLGWDVVCGVDRAGDGQGDIAVLASQFGQATSRGQFAGAMPAPAAGEHDVEALLDLKVEPTGRASFRHILALVEGGGMLLPHADNQLHAPAVTEVIHASRSGQVNAQTPAWGREDGQRPPDHPIAVSYTGPADLSGQGTLDHVFGSLIFGSIPTSGFVLRESLHRTVVVVLDQGDPLDSIVDAETGDLNSDGQPDLVLSYQSDPWVSVVFGPVQSGTREVPGELVARFGPADRDAGDHRAQSIAVADVTGDGVHDLIVGDKWHGDQRGAVYVWRGPFTPGNYGIDSVHWRLEGEGPGARMGEQVVAGDWNGDGVDGIAVSSSYYGQEQPGLVYVFSGPLLADSDVPTSESSVIMRGEAPGALAGFSVEACDTDRDMRDELVVGSPWLDVVDKDDRGGVVYWVSDL